MSRLAPEQPPRRKNWLSRRADGVEDSVCDGPPSGDESGGVLCRAGMSPCDPGCAKTYPTAELPEKIVYFRLLRHRFRAAPPAFRFLRPAASTGSSRSP